VAIEPRRLDRNAPPKTRLIRGHFTWSSTGTPQHAALGDDHPLIYRCVDKTVQDAGAVSARISMISVIGAPSARHRGKKRAGNRRGRFPGNEQPSKDWRNPEIHVSLHVTLPETCHALGLNRQALAHQGARTPRAPARAGPAPHPDPICAFTTDETDAPLFRLPVQPNERNGLRAICRLMVDKMTTVPKTKIGARVGRLDDEDIVRLNQAVLVFLGLAVSTRPKRRAPVFPT
jgi:mRNA-degrading endonuclease toxin of MazEF toxin-antitoxin module